MLIQINTDKFVTVDARLVQRFETDMDSTLARFRHQITRTEIHLSDENAEKSGGADKRCMLEVRPARQQPLAVTHHAPSVDEAFSGALEKLEALLESVFGRSEHHKGGQTIRHLPVAEKLS